MAQRKWRQDDLVFASPDGGNEWVRIRQTHARHRRMIDKRRTGPNVAKAMNIIGDVENKTAIILDDMIDTAGTLTEAAGAVLRNGAKSVIAVATHGVLSGPAIERISQSDINKVVITDTIPISAKAAACPKILQLTVSNILAEAIRRIQNRDSVSSLFI